jgi:aldose 1-epimerase
MGRADDPKTPITRHPFGQMPNGDVVERFTLNHGGITVRVITLGGIITEIHTPDRAGQRDDIVLGFDSLDGYLKGHPYFGCITGRYCNRIAQGRFVLEGIEYQLAKNNGPHHLHGGNVGFDKVLWRAKELKRDNGVGIELTRRSPDGEEGYPGNLDVAVRYVVTPEGELVIEYEATTDKATPVNLTNHTYFNLGGIRGGSVLDHELMLNAASITPTDETLIPTGKIQPVKGTPFDFTEFKPIGKDIDKVGGNPSGYDVNYVINRQDGPGLPLAAKVRHPKTGRTLEIYTTEPGVQLYTGNFLDGTITGKGGVAYQKHFGFCLETQHFPDSPNHPDFPTTILKPGQTFQSKTVYRFGVMK